MRYRLIQTLLIVCFALMTFPSFADEVKYEVKGVEDPLLTNVVNHVSGFRIGSSAKLNSRLRRKLIEDTREATIGALRPYGYFNPVVAVDILPNGTDKWLVGVNIERGSPVRVAGLNIELSGPGRDLPEVQKWKKEFPLKEGGRLKQPNWDRAKQEVIETLEANGYLSGQFTRHTIRVDPVAATANLDLRLETGQQAVMGKVTFRQDIVNDAVLASLQRFEPGDAYSSWLLGKLRLDLWRSGYFEDVHIVERRHLDAEPPRVDLEVDFVPRKNNSYQGSVGYGTDTLARLQFRWVRHLLSQRGDNFDVGIGWQQKNNEFTVLGNYRLPRETRSQQFWISQFAVKHEKRTFTIAPVNDPDAGFDVSRGNYNDYWLRFGKTRVRNLQGGYQQLFETIYTQYLNERHNFDLGGGSTPLAAGLPDPFPVSELPGGNSNSLVVGLEWDWPDIRGRGFDTTGHHERAWVFTSNEAWGSDTSFSQVYLSSRYNLRMGERWKLLLRAEAGYSDARTTDYTITAGDGGLAIKLTELPYLYRFKAGGSRSVRGYAFESLDSNGLGSNNVLAASAELEYRFLDKWSLAAFADIGNAFNDWSKPALKFGSGFGVRWYSVIGAMRVDVAKGWDLKGQPWRIHLTIGTPLL